MSLMITRSSYLNLLEAIVAGSYSNMANRCPLELHPHNYCAVHTQSAQLFCLPQSLQSLCYPHLLYLLGTCIPGQGSGKSLAKGIWGPIVSPFVSFNAEAICTNSFAPLLCHMEWKPHCKSFSLHA